MMPRPAILACVLLCIVPAPPILAHVGRAHQHSRDNLAHGFYRLNVETREAWEDLTMGPRLQGLALVAHNGLTYRIGGMSVSRYHPDTGQWETLPPLLEGRSSHDAVVLNGKLYVIGGWLLAGDSDSDETRWHTTAYVGDLGATLLVWKRLPNPPFVRRAPALAAADRKVYVLGGIGDDGGVSSMVHVYDTGSNTWKEGPDLPMSERMKGFGVSAFGIRDRIYVSGAESDLYVLRPGGDDWASTGYRLKQPRFFHRLLPHRNARLFFLGGAVSRSGHLNTLETVRLSDLQFMSE